MTRVDLSLCARIRDRRILSILRKTFRFLIDSDLAFRFFARTKPARVVSGKSSQTRQITKHDTQSSLSICDKLILCTIAFKKSH